MDDGRCPDKTWADAAKVLRETSLKVLKTKKLDDANAAFKELTSACGACHKAHKK